MAIIRERVVEEASRELIEVRDTVKLVDSPLDRLKKGAKGRVTTIHGDLATDPHTLLSVQFKCGGKNLTLVAEANRFRFCKHPKDEPLPDAEAVGLNDEEEA